MWRVLLLFWCVITQAADPAPGNSFLGYLETRPEWQPHDGKLRALHAAAIGLKLSDNLHLALKQYFVQDYRHAGEMALENGYLEARVLNLLRSRDHATTLNYRARTYLPLNETKRARGLRTIVRNYLIVKHEFAPWLRFTATPIVPIEESTAIAGEAAAFRDSISSANAHGPVRSPLVWLTTTDRPTVASNDTRRALYAVLEFTLAAAPEKLWTNLEAFVPRMSAIDSALAARLNRPIPRSQKQPRIPITIRLDARGGIHGDTTLIVGARALRVVIERVDTLSIRRPF